MTGRPVAIVAVLAALAATPMSADVIVFKGSDEYVETKGPWGLQGKNVVYTGKNGTRYSVAWEEIDLERSQRLSEDMHAKKLEALRGLSPQIGTSSLIELDLDKMVDELRRKEPKLLRDFERFSECASIGDHSCAQELYGQNRRGFDALMAVEEEYLDRRIELLKSRR